MKKILVTILSLTLAACGGGGGGSSSGTTENINDAVVKSEYISSSSFSSYFNRTKSETQTTEEFNQEQANNLAEISESKLITKINRTGYDANTGYATFTLEFSYKNNDLFQGPSYLIDSFHNTTTSGVYSLDTHSYEDIVFTGELEEFSLYSSDSIISCENKKSTDYSIYKTTICSVSVLIDRDKLYEYDYHVLFDINVNTLKGYKDSNTNSYSSGSYTTNTYEHFPISQLKSISIIDPDSKTVFGTFFPQ